MKNPIRILVEKLGLALTILFLGSGLAFALVATYGSITGSATVAPALSSISPAAYVLSGVNQGETKFQKVDITNDADVAINANVLPSASSVPAGESPSAVTLSLTEFDGVGLVCTDTAITNPISLAASSTTSECVKHVFDPASTPGDYGFEVAVNPV